MTDLHKMITKQDVARILWIAKAFNSYHSKGVDTVTASCIDRVKKSKAH